MTTALLLLHGRSAKLPRLVDGSRQEACGQCGDKLWVTPMMQKLAERKTVRLLCSSCYPKLTHRQ
jgi:hypothetical protein